ncbi:hypothetical protein AB1L88_16495 [Tautonia sp. JC769]|uniref:hypothetical protein n=1 Tax=Tautonia sp. JC769 TaxID=3232135 RepID=UPI00345A6549
MSQHSTPGHASLCPGHTAEFKLHDGLGARFERGDKRVCWLLGARTMSDYKTLIASTPLVREIESTTTTGDLDYDGTALEIATIHGDELLHVVVDENGESQFLFFRSEGNYRIPVAVMERIIEAAKQHVRVTG